MLAEDETLIWGDDDGRTRQVRGKSGVNRDRYKVVKFPKSLCEPCNNRRSKPLDDAYDIYSSFVQSRPSLRLLLGIDFRQVYGPGWQLPTANLARYYAKHFGCRMASSGVRIPDSLRAFLDGETDMEDGHLALVTTNAVHAFRHGLSISPEYAEADKDMTRLIRYVAVAYIGAIGVRYEWREGGIAGRSQFFHYPWPLINPFADELAVVDGEPLGEAEFLGITMLKGANQHDPT